MRVAMKIGISGYRDGQEWPPAGGTIDLPESEARTLVDIGYAEEIAVGSIEPHPAVDHQPSTAVAAEAGSNDNGSVSATDRPRRKPKG